jgi:hypothetical protein
MLLLLYHLLRQRKLVHVLHPAVVQGVLQWADVEAAVAAGCNSCKDILQYISTHQQHPQLSATQPEDMQQAPHHPGFSNRGPAGGVADSLTGVVTPLVSREHLQRQLKAWVDEGRLMKAAHNCFILPEQPI